MARPVILTLLIVMALLLAPFVSNALEAHSAWLEQRTTVAEGYPIPPVYHKFLPMIWSSSEPPYP
jgi:hypothetical protein